MVTRIRGAKGARGKNGANPTAGGNGKDASFTQNGQIGAASVDVEVTGGMGGAGGNKTGIGPGANGGNGGDASGTFNGNIINGTTPTNLTVSITATGGDGGPGGNGTTPGAQGDGGNAAVTMNGNIVQPSKTVNNITFEGIAVGGFGTHYGNASASLSGNIIQPTKATTVTLRAQAYSAGPDSFGNDGDPAFGTKTATLNGNIVQGNVNNVYLYADTYNPATPFEGSNGTASITGNIVQTNAANTGTVTLEASAQHIEILKNKVTLGKQTLDLSIGEFGPTYDARIKGNEFTGTGTNTFVFSDNAYPGPRTTPDTIEIDLAAETFVFNGDNNKLKKFGSATVSGDNSATISGTNAVNTLTGGGGDDTILGLGGNDIINGSAGNDLLTGGAGNDTIDGGDGLFDTAVYSGNYNQYTLNFPLLAPDLHGTVTDTVPGRDGVDSLKNVEFLKFSDGLYDVANHTFLSNNHAPVAAADAFATNEDTALVVPATGVLANDTDAEADPLTSVLVSGPAHGALLLNTDGSFTYTPDANFNGTDSFTYKANDGTSDSNIATVNLTINSVNDAPLAVNDAFTTDEDTALVVPAAGVLANDTDVEGDPLTSAVVTGPAHGSLVLNSDGSFTYTPDADFNGTDSFTYKANDGLADSNIATVNLTVNPVNDAPVAVNDAFATNEDTALVIPAAGVLSNDTDVDGDPLASVLVTGPAHGSLVLNADGSFNYTPDADFDGADSFTYKANDGSLDSNIATVNLTVNPVNDAPVALNDAFATNEDTALVIPAAGVLANDTDVEGDPLTSTVVTGPAHGSLLLNTDGSFTYTPDADFNGADSFTYKANDGLADSNIATVNLTVNPVNDAPVAGDDLFVLSEDTSAIGNVLVNDSDAEGDPLTSVLVTGPAHGSLVLNPNGSFTYTPDANYNGLDSFTYKANDGSLDSNVATVNLTINPVNDAPTAVGDSYNGDLNTQLTVPAPGVLGNDTDVDGDPLTSILVTQASHGVVSMNPDGSFDYMPNAGYFGTDSFTYKANDGLDDSNTVTVNLTIRNGQTFTGTPGSETVTGGPGNDTLIATTGQDTLDGGPNTIPGLGVDPAVGDTADFRNFAGGVNIAITPGPQSLGGTDTVTLQNIENLTGGAGDDILAGDSNNNYISGAGGDDILVATQGQDTLNGGGNTLAGDTADFSNFAGGVTIDLSNGGAQSLAGADSVILTDIENVTGGAGNDVFTGTAGNNTFNGAGGTDTVNFSAPLSATTVTWNGTNFTATGPDGTDTVNVEVLQGTGGPRTLLVGGPGGFATINDAIAAANAGDTILIAPGTYNENVVVNKAGLTLQGAGPGVVIEGNFTEDNGNFAGPLSVWLQTRTQAQGYSGASGTGVTVSADGVTLNNITVDDFLNGVSVSGAGVTGLSLNGVTTQHSVFGFTKPDATALNGLSVDGSTFSDEYIGAGFFNDTPDGLSKDATNTSITNSTFQNIDSKGIYMETAQGNTTLNGLTMANVGQFGRVPTFGNPPGVDGNGIDLNLKFHTYTGTVDIGGFNLTNVGGSAGQNGAIVVEGRDDAPSYSGMPADVSGLDVNIHDGTINGTSTGIRSGENKANPLQNDTGPAVDISNVTITGATADIDNHTHSPMTVTGTSGNDHYVAAQLAGSTGPIVINGLDGDDTLGGGNGDDTINGGTGNDTLYASGGSDTLTGAANSDTADFSLLGQGVNISLGNAGFQSLGSIGQVKLASIENLAGSNFNDVLSGNAGNNVLGGNGGDDTFLLSGGKDTFNGDAGNDTVDLSSLAAGVTINLAAAGNQSVGGTDTIRVADIENLIGTGLDDTLKGDANNNMLIGGSGNDTLTGGGGALDIFGGGTGDDTITGSAGVTTDVAYYLGLETGHTVVNANNLGNNNIANTVTVSGGTEGTDTLTRMDRLKFLAASHVSDLDNNGFGDLVYQDLPTGAITYVAHPGAVARTLTGTPASNSWHVIGTGQFTPDANGINAHKSGLLLQDSTTGDMEVITGIAGVNSTTTALSSASGTFSGWTAVTTGDFNGDASSDVLLQNGGTVEIAFLNGVKNAAVGTVDSIQAVATPAGANWSVVAAGDFDGDGHSDILFRNTANNDIVVDLMRGNTVESTATLSPGANFQAVATGDFDGNGTSDILFQNTNDGSAEIWTMNGTSLTGTIGPITGPGAGFTLAGAEDVNGDGVSDLIWHNGGNGETQATLMLAGGLTGATSQIGIAPPNTLQLIASTGGG